MQEQEIFKAKRKPLTARITLVTLSGAPSHAAFEAHLADMKSWLLGYQQRGERAILLIDPSAMTKLDASVRRVYGQWRAENIELIGQTVERAAYVANSALWRGILTAVFWFARPVVPVKLVPNQATGLEWIDKEGEKGDF